MKSLLQMGGICLLTLVTACGGGGEADTGHYAGGTLTGLAAGNSVVISSGQQSVTLSADGSYRFGRFPSGTTYDIAASSASDAQSCLVTNGSGVIGNQDVDNVEVNCVSNRLVGGTLNGYQQSGGPVRVSLNGGAPLDLVANGGFAFPGRLPQGSAYSVAIVSQPTSLACTLTNGVGTVSADDVMDVAINCVVTTGTVQVEVRGLVASDPFLLRLDGSQLGALPLASRELSAADNGTYSFAAAVPVGSTYVVSLAQTPRGHVCVVASNGIGTLTTPQTVSVTVDCSLPPPPQYEIRGSVWVTQNDSPVTVTLYDGNQNLVGSVQVFWQSTTLTAIVPYLGSFSFGRSFPDGFSYDLSASCDDGRSGTINGADADESSMCNWVIQ